MFDKAKQMYQLQKKAKEIKKQLKNIHIEAEVDGIIVIIDGEQNVIEVKIPEEMKDMVDLGKKLVEAFNKAVKKSQQVAAERMKEVMGDMGFPGLG